MEKGSFNSKKKHKRFTLFFFILTIFISLPIFILFYLGFQGFTGQSGDQTPVDVSAHKITRSTAEIIWYTERKTRGIVEYGVSPDTLNSLAEEAEAGRDHNVELTLLTSATTYYYQLRINGKVYDNEGSPWVFTTKTKDGKDVIEEVKGITTQLKREPTQTATEASIIDNSCIARTCDEVRLKIGKGCGSTDYVRCIKSNGVSLSSSSASLSRSILSSEIIIPPTITPTPTSILIVSNSCALSYVQSGKDCTEWTWDGIDTKPQICRDAFDRYVLQCRNASFTQSTDLPIIWYHNSAITNYATTSAKLKLTPINGETVYCQVRAEDEMGGNKHATNWVRAERKCSGI